LRKRGGKRGGSSGRKKITGWTSFMRTVTGWFKGEQGGWEDPTGEDWKKRGGKRE